MRHAASSLGKLHTRRVERHHVYALVKRCMALTIWLEPARGTDVHQGKRYMQQKRCVAFESHVTRKYRVGILRSQSANQLEKAHLPEVDANFQQVQQGFINIMDNARYAFADTSASRVPNRLPGIDCLTLYRKIKRVYIAPPPHDTPGRGEG